MNRSPEIYTPSQPNANDQDLWQSFRNEQNQTPDYTLKHRHHSLGHASLKTVAPNPKEILSLNSQESTTLNPIEATSSDKTIASSNFKNPFPTQHHEFSAHAQTIQDQVETIYRSNHHCSNRSDNLELARDLLEHSDFTPEAIAAYFGPSLILELEQTDQLPENFHLIKTANQPTDTTANSLNLSTFINNLANLSPKNCLDWQQSCKEDIIDHLKLFSSDPNLQIDLISLVENSSDFEISRHLLDIANYVPDFDIKSYLDNLAESKPTAFMENADWFLDLNYNYPVRDIADHLRTDALRHLKYSPTPEYREFYQEEYTGYLVSLCEDSTWRTQSTDQDIAYLNQIINEIEALSQDPSAVYHPNIALGPISDSVIDTFSQKANSYLDNMILPRHQLAIVNRELQSANPSTDLADLSRQQIQLLAEIQHLASTTLASFTPDELSYFRRYYISRASSYDGTEDMGSLFTIDNPNFELTCLHTADIDFEDSDEFYDYLNHQYEDRVLDEWGELLATYPGIFNQVDDPEVRTLVADTLKDFPVERLDEVDELKRHQYYREADQKLVQIISDFLHLPETPKIVYESESDLYAGLYNPSPNSVTLVRDREGDESFEWQDIVNVIAHELWHAHQYDEVSRDTERGRLYDINFDHYFDPGYSSAEFSTYDAQLVEVEARAFGEAFEKLYCERDPDSQTRITVYPAEAFNQAFYR